jgi:hypothetical protein
MADNFGFLIINQDLGGHTAKIFKTQDQAFVGVLGIFALHCHEVKLARVTQRVDGKMYFPFAPGHHRAQFGPVVLQLTTRRRLKPHCGPRPSQRPFWRDVRTQNAVLARITRGLDLAQNHLRVPHPLVKQPIDHRLVRVELAPASCRPPTRWCSATPQCAAYRARMNTHLRGYVLDV